VVFKGCGIPHGAVRGRGMTRHQTIKILSLLRLHLEKVLRNQKLNRMHSHTAANCKTTVVSPLGDTYAFN
jgi:hypothetical protein